MTQAAEKTEQTEDALYNSFVTAPYTEQTEDGHLFELPGGETARVDADEFGDTFPFELGDEVELWVEQPWGEHWQASVRKARRLREWDELEKQAEEKAVVEGLIVSQNKGGLSVDIGLRAFCPRSQIDIHRVDDASPYVGRIENFQITEFDPERCNVVVSRRNVIEGERDEQRRRTLDELEKGKVFTGVVRSIKKYGAFVDIGGIDGLLHVSNMSWGRIDHPSELVRPGDEIEVVVLDYDAERDRLSLGRKQLLEDPWSDIQERVSEGDIVTGKVVSLADFGAFVEIAPGLEGLVHVTELSWTERIHHPRDVLELGQEVRVKVIGIDTDNKRISLSVKRLEANPWEELAKELEPGDVVEGPIRNITDFGLFVEAAPSVEGLVHVSDISWTEKIDDPHDHYKVGETVEAKIIDIDVDNQRLGLGIKQLSRDPWAKAAEVAKPGKKIEVEITRLTDFGAFAQVVEGVEGLIHISELSPDRVESAHEVVRPGQTVEALVLSFDRSNQRVSLSLKRDELEEERASEYIDEEGATAKLGDILRDRLGLGFEDEAETDEKETHEKETDEKETDEKETDEKETDEKETDEKETDEKDGEVGEVGVTEEAEEAEEAEEGKADEEE